jgi:hypothetical protein
MNAQAIGEAKAMAADLSTAETLVDLGQLYVNWIGYNTLEDDPGQTFEDIKGVLQDYIREFCYTCGIDCSDVGL